MKARFLTIAVLCVCTGCGSVTSGLNFQAPGGGWTASPSILGRTQIWIKQDAANANGKSVLILIRGVSSNRDVLAGTQFGNTNEDVKQDRIRICGGEQADHYTGEGETQTGAGRHRATIEAVVASVRDERYMAMYIRPLNTSADPQAETAIRSLCAKPS